MLEVVIFVLEKREIMRREDLTTGNALCEAVGIVCILIYIGLQVYCGLLYGAGAVAILLNVIMVALVYAGLTLLAFYPERVNGLDAQICTGKVRKLTIHMVLYMKLIFVMSLLFTSICDVMGKQVDGAYSLITAGLMIVIAVLYEIKIFQLLKNNQKKK